MGIWICLSTHRKESFPKHGVGQENFCLANSQVTVTYLQFWIQVCFLSIPGHPSSHSAELWLIYCNDYENSMLLAVCAMCQKSLNGIRKFTYWYTFAPSPLQRVFSTCSQSLAMLLPHLLSSVQVVWQPSCHLSWDCLSLKPPEQRK